MLAQGCVLPMGNMQTRNVQKTYVTLTFDLSS